MTRASTMAPTLQHQPWWRPCPILLFYYRPDFSPSHLAYSTNKHTDRDDHNVDSKCEGNGGICSVLTANCCWYIGLPNNGPGWPSGSHPALIRFGSEIDLASGLMPLRQSLPFVARTKYKQKARYFIAALHTYSGVRLANVWLTFGLCLRSVITEQLLWLRSV